MGPKILPDNVSLPALRQASAQAPQDRADLYRVASALRQLAPLRNKEPEDQFLSRLAQMVGLAPDRLEEIALSDRLGSVPREEPAVAEMPEGPAMVFGGLRRMDDRSEKAEAMLEPFREEWYGPANAERRGAWEASHPEDVERRLRHEKLKMLLGLGGK